jgi:hypothetical protein
METFLYFSYGWSGGAVLQNTYNANYLHYIKAILRPIYKLMSQTSKLTMNKTSEDFKNKYFSKNE